MLNNHFTVLLKETIENLNVKKDGIYIDCTVGCGGHSEYLLSILNKNGHIYAFDKDESSLKISKIRLKKYYLKNMITFFKSDFKDIFKILYKLNINKVDGIIYDLGISSFQLNNLNRGFSYKYNSFLDMRINKNQYLTAYKVINFYSYNKLVRIFLDYGGKKFSRLIAKKICFIRKKKYIKTTFELNNIIKSNLPFFLKRKKHPSRKIFQAIRIEVNDEINSLIISLKKIIKFLNKKSRICIITFHSLEYKIVKKFYKNYNIKNFNDIFLDIPLINNSNKKLLKLISKKPILPSFYEINKNNSSRSAKLIVIEKN